VGASPDGRRWQNGQNDCQKEETYALSVSHSSPVMMQPLTLLESAATVLDRCRRLQSGLCTLCAKSCQCVALKIKASQHSNFPCLPLHRSINYAPIEFPSPPPVWGAQVQSVMFTRCRVGSGAVLRTERSSMKLTLTRRNYDSKT
jgi:hypothetical protein